MSGQSPAPNSSAPGTERAPQSDAAPITGSVASQSVTEGVYPRRWAALSVLVVSLLVVVLDNTVLNVALKTIQQDLGATQSQLIWAINAYTLVFASLLFTWGVLGDKFGRKRIVMIGLAMFGIASALCAFATSPGELIAFRALMGIGGASVMPVSLSIITVIFPPQERGKAIGLWAAAVGGAVALGPVVGGLLLEHPNWFRWLTGNDWGSVFFINVPIIIAGLIGIYLIVPETKNPHPSRLDPIGLVLSFTGLVALVYGIQEGAWGSGLTYVWIGIGVLILAGFVFFERRTDHPSLDLSLFKIRSFSVPLISVSLSFAALQGTLLFLAFYMQLVRGYSPLQAGLLTVPFAIGQLLAAPRSAKMVKRFGARKVMSFGVSMASLAMFALIFITPETAIGFIVLNFFIFGFGLGNVIAPSTTRMTLATPPARSGAGAAVQNTVRQVAAALGVAIISSIVATVYFRKIDPVLPSTLPESLRGVASDSIGGAYEVAGKLVAQGKATAAQVAPLIDAANASFMTAFHVAAICSLVLLLSALTLIVLRLPAQAQAVAWGAHAQHGDDKAFQEAATHDVATESLVPLDAVGVEEGVGEEHDDSDDQAGVGGNRPGVAERI